MCIDQIATPRASVASRGTLRAAIDPRASLGRKTALLPPLRSAFRDSRMHTPSLSLFASQVAALRATKAQPAKSRAVVVTRAAKDPRGVYIGKGKWIQDDDAKYASRDDWFTGGWPGGEVGLKEGFIQEPFEKPSGVQAEEYDLPEDYKGEDTVYIGKGKYVKGDAKKFAGRDNLFTGGWAGGEVSLKNAEQLKLKVGDYVQIKEKSGGIFGFFATLTGGPPKTGTVKKVEAGKSGAVKVTVSVLPFDNAVVYSGDELEKIDAN